jgi:hypothetical protein
MNKDNSGLLGVIFSALALLAIVTIYILKTGIR